MDLATLHSRLPELAPAGVFGVLGALGAWRESGASGVPDPAGLVSAAEAHASAGCTRCARTLVNAREIAVELALSSVSKGGSDAADGVAPAASLRARVLAAAGTVLGAREPREARFFDPAGTVAALHVGGAGEELRAREVLALRAGEACPDDACGRLLDEMRALVGFPLAFVAVVQGPRVAYREQRGLDPAFAGITARRRETSFCTHAVNAAEEGAEPGAAPFVVCDAAREPFFRASKMVLREGVRAYVGVPLRSARGVILGTLCAMDFVPRAIDARVVRVLDLYAAAVSAEIERARGGAGIARAASGAPLHDAPVFRELCTLAPKRSALVLVDMVPEAAGVGLAERSRPGEPVGRLGGRWGALIPGGAAEGAEGAEGAAERRSRELASALVEAGAAPEVVTGEALAKVLG
jgi:hypothetical protein